MLSSQAIEEFEISIHALREEGDQNEVCGLLVLLDFYPRPPRGGRPGPKRTFTAGWIFLSTPSARRATLILPALALCRLISIHALREEGDCSRLSLSTMSRIFLSTPSARRATCASVAPMLLAMAYFYPRPPRGGRLVAASAFTPLSNFYPRPPRGGRLVESTRHGNAVDISIHALREEGDGGPRGPFRFLQISIHALREEGDRRCSNHPEQVSGFLSTPSARRATREFLSSVRFNYNFYPRPPRGGRRLCRKTISKPFGFLSTPSARRATKGPLLCRHDLRHFYPRPPRGGRRNTARQ